MMRTITLHGCILYLILSVDARFDPLNWASSHRQLGAGAYQFTQDLWKSLGTFPSPSSKKASVQLARRGSQQPLAPGKCSLKPHAAVGLHSATSPASTTATKTTTLFPTSSGKSSSPWNLSVSLEGETFFDGWWFWSTGDPTDGTVNYLDQQTAASTNLTSINSKGHAIMKVDTTPVVSGNRNSIRIESNAIYNGGLLIADIIHIPYGCGTWPAFWSNGPDWPQYGEIDIVEGVNENTENQSSAHTRDGCSIPSSYGATGTLSLPAPEGLDCAALETDDSGCGQIAPNSNTYGPGFNNNGGGVYATLWDTTGIQVFFFPRPSIPSDLSSGAPQPTTWGTPVARWPATQCNPYEFFVNHTFIFDTTLCGFWAGSAGAWDASCAASTGVSTCAEFVQNNGAAFEDAYWEVVSVKLYHSS